MGASEGWVRGASGWFFCRASLEGEGHLCGGERWVECVWADYFHISPRARVRVRGDGGVGGGRSIGGGAVTIL